MNFQIVDDSLRYRYQVQVGHGAKGKYKTRYSVNRLASAELLYRGINLGNGYKKRLVDNGKVIARESRD